MDSFSAFNFFTNLLIRALLVKSLWCSRGRQQSRPSWNLSVDHVTFDPDLNLHRCEPPFPTHPPKKSQLFFCISLNVYVYSKPDYVTMKVFAGLSFSFD